MISSMKVACPHCGVKETCSTSISGAVECDVCGEFFLLYFSLTPRTTQLFVDGREYPVSRHDNWGIENDSGDDLRNWPGNLSYVTDHYDDDLGHGWATEDDSRNDLEDCEEDNDYDFYADDEEIPF